MVINNDPTYAYLLQGNAMVDQKLVMAHVHGHADFFLNNVYYAHTNRKMIDAMANHATRVRRHMERHGVEAVERFLDASLSVEDLIDPGAVFRARPRTETIPTESDEPRDVGRLPAKPYLDRYVNPPAYIEERRQQMNAAREEAKRVPASPERDVLGFVLGAAPLDPWERDVLELVRDESYYFLPQRQTKVMNEGWASYWHTHMMTTRILNDAEVIDYADHHSGTVAVSPGRLNPYKLGLELFRDIEERWNKGQFGKEWTDCEDMAAKRSWDRRLGLGRQKIFEVRKLYNDVTFIDEFFTLEFCHDQKFYAFGYNDRSGNWEIESREFKKVKERLLFKLTNHGQPFIYVTDGNFENRGELLLKHQHEGVDLKLDHGRDTLQNLNRVWKRPVNILTKIEGKGKLLRFDGRDHSEKSADYPEKLV
jgi:stage V sporulation protein R